MVHSFGLHSKPRVIAACLENYLLVVFLAHIVCAHVLDVHVAYAKHQQSGPVVLEAFWQVVVFVDLVVDGMNESCFRNCTPG